MANSDLPNLGNGIDFRPWWERVRDDFQAAAPELTNAYQSPLYRIGVERNINPEFTQLMGGLLGHRVQDQINKGLLDFEIEAPNFNSDRYYVGMNWRF